MDPTKLIPTPDVIPAPSWLFLLLGLLTFLLHILVINVALGGSLITLFSRLKSESSLERDLHGAIASKLPVTFALGINLGVAPLLFLQVIYGHLFYTSSVLLAVYWILVIPLLIIAYYGAYVHIRNYDSHKVLSRVALAITSVILLYIGFIYVNNMTLMAQPEKWNAYFANRGGTFLNTAEPTLIPRYLHFVVASIAVAGLFSAIVWNFRKKKHPDLAPQKIKSGLQIFAIATAVQMAVGFWFLLSLPRDIMLQFMGQNLTATIFLFLGMVLAVVALIGGFLNKLSLALIHLLATIIVMVILRAYLRSMYLRDSFHLGQLEMRPQYGVMILFFIVLVIGLIIVGYMVKTAVKSEKEGAVA
ncbi:MAG: hypothetical protein Kow0042_21350 [Calditrichia bacterium]